MMKQLALVGTLVTALGAGAPSAQGPAATQTPAKPAAAPKAAPKPAPVPARTPAAARRAEPETDEGALHVAPKVQPITAPAPSVPTGEMPLGTVRLDKAVKADGKALPSGTYEIRLTAQTATPVAKGETPGAERWVEFLQEGKVKGREVVSIIPQSEISQVQKDPPPRLNGSKVETLKGGEYVRVWIDRNGDHYLIHLPTA